MYVDMLKNFLHQEQQGIDSDQQGGFYQRLVYVVAANESILLNFFIISFFGNIVAVLF